MQCLLTALKAESQPLIDHFGLTKDSSFLFPVFKRDNLYLIGIGVGKKRIKDRIETFCKHFIHEKIQFINIGIAGGNHSSTKIGACYLLHKIKDETTGKTYYPDILIKHNFEEKSLVTVDSVISDGEGAYKGLVDMEASEIFNVCSSLVPVHRLAFLKIVSDYMNLEFEEIIAQPISNLIALYLDSIELFLSQLEGMLIEENKILSEDDLIWINETVQKISLTKTQSLQLLQRAKGFRLRTIESPFPELQNKSSLNKTSQKIYFKQICDQLSA
jgi:nucleoside phosphorylase